MSRIVTNMTRNTQDQGKKMQRRQKEDGELPGRRRVKGKIKARRRWEENVKQTAEQPGRRRETGRIKARGRWEEDRT